MVIKKIKNIKFFSFFVWSLLFICFFSDTQAFAISINQEKKLGVKFMKMINSSNSLIHDPVVCDFVTKIGERIVAQLPPHPFRFSFHIVNEDQFNAFSAPAANIFVNRGLVTALDNADELAGILGHEIGHTMGRHVSKMIDRSKLVSIGTFAGMLAGIVIGTAGGGGGDAAQAVIMSSAAAGQTTMLAYSRAHEREADRFGLYYVKKAGFSPKGLLTSLEKIKANDWYGTDKIPGYLLTHPGADERIIYMKSWLADHDKGKDPYNGIDPVMFNMIKYRMMGMYGNRDTSEIKFKHLLEKAHDDPALNYGLALVLARKSQLNQAISHLKTGLFQRPFDPMILLAMGRIYLMQGLPQKADGTLKGLESVQSIKTNALYYQGDAELKLGKLNQAKEKFKKVLKKAPSAFPKCYFYLGKIASVKNKQGLSHYYLGLYYHEIRDFLNERFHLKQSLKTLTDSEKIKKARKLLKQLKKKRIRS